MIIFLLANGSKSCYGVANFISAHYYKDGLYNMLMAKDGHRAQFLIEWDGSSDDK